MFYYLHRIILSIPSIKQKRESQTELPLIRLAATYFSTNKCSIIGEERLNFSVRNGKR